jgi:hypothetical protein
VEQLVSYTSCKPTRAQTGGPRPRLNPRTPAAAVWTPFNRYLVPIAYSISAVTVVHQKLHHPFAFPSRKDKEPNYMRTNDPPSLWVTSGSTAYPNLLRHFHLYHMSWSFRAKVVLIGLTTMTWVRRSRLLSTNFSYPTVKEKERSEQKTIWVPKGAGFAPTTESIQW